MQGDIMLPRPKRSKAVSKPKLGTQAPEPDIIIDESSPSEANKKRLLVAPHKHFIRFWRFWLSKNRNVRFAIIAVGLLIFGAGALGWYYFIQPSSEPGLTLIRHPKPAPSKTVASPLTGVQIAPELAKRPVTGVMIENSTFARPQSGLQDAGVVVEAIAEGGITRFLALFQEGQPKYLGPVRSLRPYYIDFAAPFQASIVHVGGSPDALKTVRNGHYRDLDQFFNAGYFSRVSSRDAPHNVYTGFKQLDALNKAKRYKSSLFTSWPRKDEAKLKVPSARKIDITISGPLYYSHYDYDSASNTYLRSEGGSPHMELKSTSDKKGVRIHPKVVVALVMAYNLAADHKHSVYADTGTGRAYVFQDGGVSKAIWQKDSSASQLVLKDAEGQALKLNAGQTWITLVAAKTMVHYKP